MGIKYSIVVRIGGGGSVCGAAGLKKNEEDEAH